MAKHKRATEVTVVPVSESSALQVWLESNWKLLAGLAIAGSAVILGLQAFQQREAQAELRSWETLHAEVNILGTGDPVVTPTAERMRELADEVSGGSAGPWARMLATTAAMDERDWEGARAALASLRSDHPDHPLCTALRDFDPGSPRQTAVEYLSARLEAQAGWAEANARLFENPALPEGAPRVRINTTAGAIVVALESERAPAHVENFLKLCGEGFYDGTRFHRVVPGFMVQGGDPNTRDEDRTTWGTGGPGYKLDAELTDELHHFTGVLSAAKLPQDVQSSGSGFFLTTGSPFHLDGQHTIFGRLLEGAPVVEAIESSPLDEGSDRPVTPTTIESTEVL